MLACFMTKNNLLPSWAKKLLRSARQRAKTRGIDFFLSVDDMGLLVNQANGVCSVSKIPFDTSCRDSGLKKFERNPYAPSIDRIDSTKGYFLENCRLVSIAVNYALGTWGDSVLKTIALGVCGVNYKHIDLPDVPRIGLPYVKVRQSKVKANKVNYHARFYCAEFGECYAGSFNSELDAYNRAMKLKRAYENGEDMTKLLPVLKNRPNLNFT